MRNYTCDICNAEIKKCNGIIDGKYSFETEERNIEKTFQRKITVKMSVPYSGEFGELCLQCLINFLSVEKGREDKKND